MIWSHRGILLWALLLWPCFSFSATSSPLLSLPPLSLPTLSLSKEGNAVALKEIRAVLTESEYLQGRFMQQQSLPGVVEPLVSQGQFYFVRDRALLWQTQTPFVSDVVFRSERQRGQSAAQRRMSKLLLDVFGANILDDEDFAHEVSGSSLDWQILLTPRGGSISKYIAEIELRGGQRLQTTTIVFTAGRQSHIAFAEVVAHLEMPEQFCQSISDLCESS